MAKPRYAAVEPIVVRGEIAIREMDQDMLIIRLGSDVYESEHLMEIHTSYIDDIIAALTAWKQIRRR